MAIDKKLQIFDDEGNPVDYDILASDVKFNDGKDLPTKMAELEQEIGDAGSGDGTVTGVKVGNTPYSPDGEGVVDLSTPFNAKVDKETGKSLMTDAERTKLQNLPTADQLTSQLGQKANDADVVKSVSVNGQNPQTPQNGNVNIEVQGGTQGPKGDKGDTVVLDTEGLPVFTIVNDLTTGGASDALSAEMGRRLRLGKGTFAAAWARSKADNVLFAWIWDETVDNEAICKPIWHIGSSVFIDAIGASVNVDAEAVPFAPTFSINNSTPTNNSEVNKNTELVITPATDSVLYYKIGSGSYVASDKAVTVVLDTAGETYAFESYCKNNKGDSTHATLTLSVAGIPVPTFAAASGTTIDANNVVSRGGYVMITGEVGGTLHYKVGNAVSYTDVTGVGGAAPMASVQITGATTIKAYNTIDGDNGSEVTNEYTMAALDAPTFSIASGTEVAAGTTVTITAPVGATLKVDGTSIASQTHTVTINAAQSITAISVDAYGESSASTAQYTIAIPKIKVVATDSTTMSLGDSGLTSIPINQGTNEFTIQDINTIAGTTYSSFNDHSFNSLSFATKGKIKSFKGGGVKIKSLKSSFYTEQALEYVDGITIDGGDVGNCFSAASYSSSGCYLSLSGRTTNCQGLFYNTFGTTEIDIRDLDTSQVTGLVSFAGMFQNCHATTIHIGNLTNSNASSGGMGNGYTTMWSGCNITDLWCHETTPPAQHQDCNWAELMVTERGNNVVTIHVPNGTLNAYKSAWGDNLAVNWVEF